jgi:hypothetical protein
MKLAICIMHAAFEPQRHNTLAKLLRPLCPDVDTVLHVEYDDHRNGAWATARKCWEWGIEAGVDWIVVLNDDAVTCDNFVEQVREALAQRDERDPVCLYTAHPLAPEALRARWYTTHDDLVGVGCALSRDSAADFLAWVDANPGVSDTSDDGRLNMWAMATARLIWTTVPSLVDHQLPDDTTVTWSKDQGGGWNIPHARVAVVPPDTGVFLDGPTPPAPHFGRMRAGNHWELLHLSSEVNATLIERAYAVERHGVPVSTKPHVFIAMPAARAPELAVRVSVQRTQQDLLDHGIECTVFESPGDSLVTRGRHCLSHVFLTTTATHFLQWDDDVEILDPSAVRKMVESRHNIVGCAYPWRDGSGRVVCNPLPETAQYGYVDFDTHQCCKVSEIGTGFLMVSRQCLVDLAARHPEDMYQADIEPYIGAPMWALFDARIELSPNGRKRYASEDWRFCSIARAAGYGVWLYYPPVLQHWGKVAHKGHVTKSWGMGETKSHYAGDQKAAE